MKRIKWFTLMLSIAVLCIVFTGCANQAKQYDVDPNEAAAMQLLTDLEGTYREL